MNEFLDDNRIKKLREVQLKELEIIRVFVDICSKENLKYYIIGGTMLGAIRHKGFIPWDDDVDIAMPRPDYEKFLKIGEKYLSNRFKLQTHQNTANHDFYFSRLVDSENKIIAHFSKMDRIDNIWIDIFPFDGMPNNPVDRKLHQLHLLFRRVLFQYAHFDEQANIRRPHRPWYEKILLFIGLHFPIEKLLLKENQWKAMDRVLKSVPYDSSDYIINMAGAYKLKEMIHKRIVGEGKLYEFEGLKLNGPEDYNAYLTHFYGDYMTPPPENERNWHSTEL